MVFLRRSGAVEQYVLGVFVPMVLSGVLFVLAARMRGWLSADAPDCPERRTLPAASGTYVFAALVAGALAEVGSFLLNKGNTSDWAFAPALFWLGYLGFICWIGRSADAGKRADQNRTSLVFLIPFVSAMWITAVILSLALR